MMDGNRIWLWLLPVMILAACAIWQTRQNAALRSQLQQALNETHAPAVVTPCPESSAVMKKNPEASTSKPITPLEDVFNAEPGSPQQSALDGIKNRYEELLVNYFFLRKCKKTFPTDYHVILSALGQEMAAINAPGRLQGDIITAAQGSYKEMYARNNCLDPNVDTLAVKYRHYIDAVTKEYVAP